MCWVDSEVRRAGVGLRNIDGAEKRRRRMCWDGRRGTEVPDREDSGTPWHPLTHSLTYSLTHLSNSFHLSTVCWWRHWHWYFDAATWSVILGMSALFIVGVSKLSKDQHDDAVTLYQISWEFLTGKLANQRTNERTSNLIKTRPK